MGGGGQSDNDAAAATDREEAQKNAKRNQTFHIVASKLDNPEQNNSRMTKLWRFSASSTRFYQGVGWRSYEHYIGARVLEADLTDRIKRNVMSSDRVARAIATYAGSARYSRKSERALKRDAAAMLDGMAGDLSSRRAARFMVYVVSNVLMRLFHQGIFVNEEQFARIKEAAIEAERQKIPLVFLPCHKSHIDYLVLGFLFYRLGISLPFVASGDNLNMPVVGNLLRQSGAFFHRRSFSDDPLYTAVFKAYLETILSMGHNIQAFVEGTRSRTGKLLNPKLGVLKIVTEAVLSGHVKDAYICPISIGYDKVLETESYVNELLGAEKVKESLSQLFANTRVLALKLGRIDVRFATPFSLKSYISARTTPGPASPGGADVVLKSLAYQVLSDINSEAVIMPSGLIGTVMLTLRGRGIGRSELIQRVLWLRDEIVDRGGNVADFPPEGTAIIVDRTLAVLSGLVGVHKDLLEPVYYVTKRFELSYYRNELIHLFLVDSTVCCALYSCVKMSGHVLPERQVSLSALLAQTEALSQLMKLEFIFPPGRVADNLEQSLARLVRKNVVTRGADGDAVSVSAAELLSGRENFDFYCFLLWPFIETYWLAIISLHAIPVDSLAQEGTFMDQVQRYASTMYYEGDLSYYESINKETLKNAFMRLQEMGVIDRRKVDRLVLLSLTAEYESNGRAPLRELVESVGRFRREGKNRRDNVNTSDRTLRLAAVMMTNMSKL